MELEVLNLWWKGKEYIKEDKHIREYEKKKFKWYPPEIDNINSKLEPGNIFTLRGPRQVGKTTLVKLIIKKLLEKVNEKAIFYWSCDIITDEKELIALIENYLDIMKTFNLKLAYIFLDEISGVKNWQKAVKFLVDADKLRNCCLFLTGSHTLDIKYGMERLPGRKGEKTADYLLLPLTFRQFIKLIKPEIWKKIPKIKEISLKEIKKNLNSTRIFGEALKILFNQYLICGGFPLTINEFFKNNILPDYIYDIYYGWIIGDFVKWKKQEKILLQVLRTSIAKQGTAVNWHSFAKESEIKSHKTVSEYVEDLENMFVLLILYYLDLSKKIANFSKNKKIYFLDPFIFHVFNRKINFKEKICPSLVEAVAVINTARYLNTKENLNKSIFYWKNKKEVDIIAKSKEKLVGIEVKYQEKISSGDWAGLKYFKEGLLLTKNYYETKTAYVALPIYLFLAML